MCRAKAAENRRCTSRHGARDRRRAILRQAARDAHGDVSTAARAQVAATTTDPTVIDAALHDHRPEVRDAAARNPQAHDGGEPGIDPPHAPARARWRAQIAGYRARLDRDGGPPEAYSYVAAVEEFLEGTRQRLPLPEHRQRAREAGLEALSGKARRDAERASAHDDWVTQSLLGNLPATSTFEAWWAEQRALERKEAARARAAHRDAVATAANQAVARDGAGGRFTTAVHAERGRT
ncbi:hypothetical protein [Actinotalea sp. C106]|uniref:hypothetical protein n=1 Tax=Actinotalea sp. C106 TaxID=2908644 RepID=UPI002028152D|nr:hypothetical protein [Actinotalea sp. C106]